MANVWTEPTIIDGKYVSTYTADQAQTSGYSIIFSTANTFVDKNIQAKVIIPQGSLGAGAGSATLTNHGATGLLGTVLSSAPSSGHYLQITGSGTVSISTAGWIAATTYETSNDETKYYPIQSAAFDWGTGSNANKFYCTTSGYVAASNSTALLTMTTTSVVQTNITTISGTTATGATATWGTGYITDGSIAAATFGSEPAQNKTAASYVDISETTASPVLTSGDYLYINRGYVDDIKISLSKLVPDSALKPSGATSYSQGLLTGYALYDETGALVNGSINTITLPTNNFPNSSTTGYTSKATLEVSTLDRYIKIDSGYNAANAQYLIRAVTTTNISPANIKYGVTIKVGDSADDDRISGASGVGTFTKASTVSSGQTALSYDTDNLSLQMLSGYSAWVDGKEIQGAIVTKTSTNVTFDGATRTFTAPAGYYATNATKQIAAASLTAGSGAVSLTSDTGTLSIYSTSNAHGISINDNAPAANSGKVYIKVTGSGTVNNTVGWLNTANSTASNDKIRYVILTKYNGDYTTS